MLGVGVMLGVTLGELLGLGVMLELGVTLAEGLLDELAATVEDCDVGEKKDVGVAHATSILYRRTV